MEKDKSNTIENQNQSGNMYSYQEERKVPIVETNAIRRSIGEGNPNAYPENHLSYNNLTNNQKTMNQNSIIIHINQSPPVYWMFFLIFGIIQIVFIILLATYFKWDDFNKTPSFSSLEYDKGKIVEKNFKMFQEINIMIFLGFGFLRSFLKHHSWSSIGLNFMAGVLSFEIGLFSLVCWGAAFKKEWNDGKFNFNYFLNANYICATIVISLGAILGKLSIPQYFVFILLETIFSSINTILLRQEMHIIDIGGALTVHLFGAVFGGIFSLVSFITKDERERISINPHLGSSYNSNIFALFGTLILITYWPAFNTSLIENTLNALNENDIYNSGINYKKFKGIINTYLSILGSIVGTFIMSPLCNLGKIKIKDIINSCFSGGIIVAGCCHIIDRFWISILLGLICGALTTYLCNILTDRLKIKGYHDTSDIIYYHGIPGFLGGIITSIFVGNLGDLNEKKSKEDLYSNIGAILTSDGIYGKRNISQYAGVHFSAIIITIAIAAACGLFTGFVIKFCNCNIAKLYFNDSEFYDVSENEHFPWDDEQVGFQVGNNEKFIQ